MLLIEEKKRIVQHPLFLDEKWISKPKVTFNEEVVFKRNYSEDSIHENENK